MADIEAIIRGASQRPLKDAAFYVWFHLNQKNAEGNIYSILNIAHGKASDLEINHVVSEAEYAGQYCYALNQEYIKNPQDLVFLSKKVRENNPGYMLQTYELFNYCVRDQKADEVASSDLKLQENLENDREWSDIPYFRKPLFLLILFILFTPGFLIIIWTGDVYYKWRGFIHKMKKGTKWWFTFFILLPLLRAILKNI